MSQRRRLPRRWPMILLTDAIAACMPRRKKLCDVVVFRMFGIGDALLFRAVLGKHGEAFNVPLDEITIFGSTSWKAASDLFFRDVEVIAIDERRFSRNFFYRLKIMRNLRRRGFLIGTCGMRFRYPHVVESLILASAAPRRIVVEPRPNEKYNGMFRHYLKRMTTVIPMLEVERPRASDGSPLPLMHEITHQLEFLSKVAGKPITLNSLPKLALRPRATPLVNAEERYVILNIGASHAPRRWPLPFYAELARRFLGQDLTVVVLGGPSEENVKGEVAALMPKGQGRGRILISINELNLPDAAQLVNQSDLVISNDTGLGHMAIMLGKPAVLLVGGGHFGSFMPYPSELTPAQVRFLYHPMPCYHCNWNCTEMKPGDIAFPCVQNISVDSVWNAARELTEGL